MLYFPTLFEFSYFAVFHSNDPLRRLIIVALVSFGSLLLFVEYTFFKSTFFYVFSVLYTHFGRTKTGSIHVNEA
jgi:hypothetical protein